jgi:hypothetical protein
MRLHLIVFFIILTLYGISTVSAQISDYQEIHHGGLPIILEAPHGGNKDIPSIRPNPKIGGRDTYTLELTRLIRQRMMERTGKSPEVVAMLANRNFIDVNRKPGPKAYQHSFTKKLYQAHYVAIDKAIQRVKDRHGSGLMVLIHSGWNYPVQIAIGVNRYEKWTTIPYFVKHHGWNVFHGSEGIGGHLHRLGYEVSGYGNAPPDKDYTGLPALTRTRKSNNIGIDGMQFEFQGRALLRDVKKREKLARDIADILLQFVHRYYTPVSFKNE